MGTEIYCQNRSQGHRSQTWRRSSTRTASRSTVTGAAMAARTGTRSSGRLALGSLGSQGTHFTCHQGATSERINV